MHSPKFRTEVKSKFTKLIERVAELGAASASEEGSVVRGPNPTIMNLTVRDICHAEPKIVARPIY